MVYFPDIGIVIVLIIMAIGFVIDSYLLVHYKRHFKPNVSTKVPWSFGDVLNVFFICLLFQFIFTRLSFLISDSGKTTILFFLLNKLVVYIIFLVSLYAIVYRKSHYSIQQFFNTKGLFIKIFYGIMGYVGFLPILFYLDLFTHIIGEAFDIPFIEQGFILHIKENIFSIQWVFLLTTIILITPIIEECFFRGFLYPVIKRRFGMIWGVVLTALFFSLLHVNFTSFLPIFGVGISLAIMYEMTGSLITPIVLHVCYNGVGVLCLIFFSVSGGK